MEEPMASSGVDDAIVDTDVGDAPQASGEGDELEDLLSGGGSEEETEGGRALDEAPELENETEAGQAPGESPHTPAIDQGLSTGSGSQQNEGYAFALHLSPAYIVELHRRRKYACLVQKPTYPFIRKKTKLYARITISWTLRLPRGTGFGIKRCLILFRYLSATDGALGPAQAVKVVAPPGFY
jgi:hypothetical protein